VGAAVGVGNAGDAVTVAWLGAGEAEAGVGWDAVVPDEHATRPTDRNASIAKRDERPNIRDPPHRSAT